MRPVQPPGILAAKSGGAMNELEALELFAALGIECVQKQQS